MRILIAPNAFKHALTAPRAAEAIHKGLAASKLKAEWLSLPAADGGDGTGSLLVQQLRGLAEPATVSDPLGRPIASSFGWLEAEKTAIIEMADASGLRLISPEERNPLLTTSVGMGQLMRKALDKKPVKMIICIGGSATVDAATGALEALGLVFFDADGQALRNLPQPIDRLHGISTSELDSRLSACELVVLCDVENPLLGPQGAAAVFGPQKGASPADVVLLDNRLRNWRDVVQRQTGIDMQSLLHGGAAGGTAASFSAVLGARLVGGADYFLDLVGFDTILDSVDLVITGEGSLDQQTLHGKGPFAIARRARNKNKKTIGLAGLIRDSDRPALAPHFDQLICINKPGDDPEQLLANCYQHLFRCAQELGDALSSET